MIFKPFLQWAGGKQQTLEPVEAPTEAEAARLAKAAYLANPTHTEAPFTIYFIYRTGGMPHLYGFDFDTLQPR